jgi:hypothetical protein
MRGRIIAALLGVLAAQAAPVRQLQRLTDSEEPVTTKVVRTTPMTAKEWAATYDACVAALGQPVILAGRNPGISAGVGCIPIGD